MLAWRISRYTSEGVEIRLRHCNRLLRLLDRALASSGEHPGAGGLGTLECDGVGKVLPGIRAHRHTLWLLPVMVEGGASAADRVVEDLLREGFDATRASTSLVPISRRVTPPRV